MSREGRSRVLVAPEVIQIPARELGHQQDDQELARVQESGSRHRSLQRGYALTISSIRSTNACRCSKSAAAGGLTRGKTLWKYPRIDRSIGAPSARLIRSATPLASRGESSPSGRVNRSRMASDPERARAQARRVATSSPRYGTTSQLRPVSSRSVRPSSTSRSGSSASAHRVPCGRRRAGDAPGHRDVRDAWGSWGMAPFRIVLRGIPLSCANRIVTPLFPNGDTQQSPGSPKAHPGDRTRAAPPMYPEGVPHRVGGRLVEPRWGTMDDYGGSTRSQSALRDPGLCCVTPLA